jgi:hypothetical protein
MRPFQCLAINKNQLAIKSAFVTARIQYPCPEGHGFGLTPYKGAKLAFRKGKLENQTTNVID